MRNGTSPPSKSERIRRIIRKMGPEKATHQKVQEELGELIPSSTYHTLRTQVKKEIKAKKEATAEPSLGSAPIGLRSTRTPVATEAAAAPPPPSIYDVYKVHETIKDVGGMTNFLACVEVIKTLQIEQTATPAATPAKE